MGGALIKLAVARRVARLISGTHIAGHEPGTTTTTHIAGHKPGTTTT
jgi:hypothetical protein